MTTHHPAATEQAAEPTATIGRRLAAAGACGAAALLVTALVALEWGPLLRVDNSVVADAVAWTLDRPALHQPLSVVGLVSGKVILWTFCLVMTVVLFFAHRWREALLLISTIASTTIVAGAIKSALQRERPMWYVPEDALPTSSFPSGHVALWVAFAGAVVLALPTLVRLTPVARRAVPTVLGVAIVLISLQRVLQGRHFPSDIVAGAFVGAGCVLGAWALTDLALAMWFGWLHPAPSEEPESTA